MSSGAKHNVVTLESEEQLKSLTSNYPLCVLNFWADWHEPCSHMNNVFEELSRSFPKLSFIQLQAEDFPELSESFEIDTVPTFVMIQNGKMVEKVEGANAPALSALVGKFADRDIVKKPEAAFAPTQNLDKKLKTLINSYPIMLFMKGTPAAPKCGFSRTTVELLAEVNCTYGSFDILADDEVRQGLKKYSDWPTYPQIYVNGELVGGLDILKEMISSGEFQKLIPQEEDLNTRLGKLIKKAPVMLFMKGNKETPRCGFSRTIVSLLKEQNIDFETFDILEDEEVRQGLKTFSDWPTYPQLYIHGELVGGLDIVKEMIANGELKAMLNN